MHIVGTCLYIRRMLFNKSPMLTYISHELAAAIFLGTGNSYVAADCMRQFVHAVGTVSKGLHAGTARWPCALVWCYLAINHCNAMCFFCACVHFNVFILAPYPHSSGRFFSWGIFLHPPPLVPAYDYTPAWMTLCSSGPALRRQHQRRHVQLPPKERTPSPQLPPLPSGTPCRRVPSCGAAQTKTTSTAPGDPKPAGRGAQLRRGWEEASKRASAPD